MIAPGLQPAPLENGNISIIEQRLSAISLSDCANLEARDEAIKKTAIGEHILNYLQLSLAGWGGRIRTSVWWNQNQATSPMISKLILKN
jgi:hypothetical protein